MSGSEHARPVFLTKKQRDVLYALGIRDIPAAWDAAPANPTEAVRGGLLELRGEYLQRFHEVFWHGPEAILTDKVLRALGHPEAPA